MNSSMNTSLNSLSLAQGYSNPAFAKFMSRDDDRSYTQYKNKKEQLFQGVSGTVVELGPGTGVNFPFLDRKKVRWTGVEPNRAMEPYLQANARKFGFEIELKVGAAESLPFQDASVDYVISTIVLCSVSNLESTLQEVLRVLKPGGQFLFLEHQADDCGTFRRVVQKTMPYTPWRYFSDGCNPGREIGKAIEKTGFKSVKSETYFQEGAGLILAVNRPHIYGIAVK